jgi:hypothetical protein
MGEIIFILIALVYQNVPENNFVFYVSLVKPSLSSTVVEFLYRCVLQSVNRYAFVEADNTFKNFGTLAGR